MSGKQSIQARTGPYCKHDCLPRLSRLRPMYPRARRRRHLPPPTRSTSGITPTLSSASMFPLTILMRLSPRSREREPLPKFRYYGRGWPVCARKVIELRIKGETGIHHHGSSCRTTTRPVSSGFTKRQTGNSVRYLHRHAPTLRRGRLSSDPHQLIVDFKSEPVLRFQLARGVYDLV